METSPSAAGRDESSNPVKIEFQRSIFLGLILLLGFALRAGAAGLPINILNTQYTNSVSVAGLIRPEGSGPFNFPQDYIDANHLRTSISTEPVSDSMYHPVSGILEAEANAGLFRISVLTAADGRNDALRLRSNARASSELWFSPLTSETTTINLQFSGWNQWYYSSGRVSLFDVTSDDEVWNFWWEGFTQGTVPWVYQDPEPGGPRETATLMLETDFIAGNSYKLSMHAGSTSVPADRQRILIELSGLDPIAVPEPTALSLVGFGVLVWAGRRKIGRKSQYE